MAKDALSAHARDELGISKITFAAGAALPLAMFLIALVNKLVTIVTIASPVFLALLGAVGAKAAGADIVKATARVTF